MGIQSSLDPYPSLALGVSVLSPLEHISAFGVFATKGLRAEATPVLRVENDAGTVLMESPTPVRAARVMSKQAANNMYQMLRYVVTNGTGRPVQIRGVEVNWKNRHDQQQQRRVVHGRQFATGVRRLDGL